MSYKSFRINIAMRLFFIFINMALLIYIFPKNAFWATFSGLLLLLMTQIVLLIRYIERTHRSLGIFFEAIQHSDFTRHSSKKFHSPTEKELNERCVEIQKQFQDLRQHNEELINYYGLLLEKVPVAIIIIEEKKLTLANLASQKLFQRNKLEHVEYLNQFGSKLAEDVQKIAPGEQRRTQMVLNKLTTSLSLSAATIQLPSGIRKVVSLNPIQRDLDIQEMSAWQNLVQVFTHEIMNSMTPVASLSRTAAGLLASAKSKLDEERHELYADAQQAIDIVARRADNLMKFVQAYRLISNPPVIKPQNITLAKLLDEICQLLGEEARAKHVKLFCETTPENLLLNADPAQIEQVLINLIKNALEAMEDRQDGEIFLNAYISEGGNVIVDITDNGCGIPNDKLDQVFVPFYTSKRDGTGIGLFLVKQIMQAHSGTVYAMQAERGGALMRLVF